MKVDFEFRNEMNIQSKLPGMGVTIFTRMTNLANQHGAINLSQGFPDFDVDPRLIDRVHHYMQQGCNQYAPMQGVLRLRERIAEKVKQLYGAEYDPGSEITVTSGATEALFAAITAFVRPGDEAIIIEPAFDSYEPAVRLNGGIPVFVKMDFPEYAINWGRMADAVSSRTRMIILNSPHNPTGAVLTSEDIERLSGLTKNTGILILSDEVYEHIIFDGLRHESMACCPELAARSLVIGSFGKTYHATGWKIGYCLAPRELSEEFRKAHQFITFASNTPIQMAYADIMEFPELYLELPAFYQERRDYFLDRIRGSRFRPLDCAGTYFAMLDYSAISDEPDLQFAERMIRESGVAAIPPSVFYNNGDDHRVLRFCFAKKQETLDNAAEKLCRI